jgi:hypothetical protein
MGGVGDRAGRGQSAAGGDRARFSDNERTAGAQEQRQEDERLRKQVSS